MLISPPFLPSRDSTQADEEWLELAMRSVWTSQLEGMSSDTVGGAYPVSLIMSWHGGSHLSAPLGQHNAGLPVRAIADGKVVHVRAANEQNDDLTDPLNYGAHEDRCWTSNGMVLLRHETEIGTGANNTAINVVFYSLYMHLEAIPGDIKPNKNVRRKDILGNAGYIYGQPNLIHFEIFCDDDNLRLLTGRTSGDLSLEQDGRSSVVMGELYFSLPAQTPIYERKPAANQPSPEAGATYITQEQFIIGLKYGGGDGPEGERGHASVTTYHLDGTREGEPLVEPDAEYNLHSAAEAIVDAYCNDIARPTAGAVYELLRFGRVINTAYETLTPSDMPHWRLVRHPAGQGWVNLNAANIRKFSDADFPHWKGWSFIDDSLDQDSRCDSPTVRAWFDKNHDGTVDAAEPVEGARDTALQLKLEHSICKFPTEWQVSTLDKRWGWLKTSALQTHADPLNDDDFAKFKAHAKALCFWKEATDKDNNLPENPWRFHPKTFIKHFRECSWANPLRACTLRTAGLSSIEAAKFGMTRNNHTRPHQGVDFAAAPGTPIFAVASGKVESVTHGGDYGNTITLRVDSIDTPGIKQQRIQTDFPEQEFFRVFYAHLNRIDVAAGAEVHVGRPLGLTGSTGNASNMTTVSTGSHLHFEYRTGASTAGFSTGLGNRKDPLRLVDNVTNL